MMGGDTRRSSYHDIETLTVDDFPETDFSLDRPGDNPLRYVCRHTDAEGYELNQYRQRIRNAHNQALDDRRPRVVLPVEDRLPRFGGLLGLLLSGKRLQFVFDIGVRIVEADRV